MNSRPRYAWCLPVVALVLAGCSSNDQAQPPETPQSTSSPVAATTTTPTSQSSSALSPTTSEESPTSVPEPELGPEQIEQQPAVEPEPQFVRCQMQNGTALLSDGSTTYMSRCDENLGHGGQNYPPPQSQSYLPSNLDAEREWYFQCLENNKPWDCKAMDPWH